MNTRLILLMFSLIFFSAIACIETNRDNGDECSEDSECASNYCKSSCITFGYSCSGSYCADRPLENGQMCKEDSECSSEYCKPSGDFNVCENKPEMSTEE